MVEGTVACPACREPMPPGLGECPACGARLGATAPGPVPDRTEATGTLERRLARLERWRAITEPLAIDLPEVPSWVLRRIRHQPPEDWVPFLDEVELSARQAVLDHLATWRTETLARLQRLEAYAIDGRLEREQVEDVLAAVRSGEIDRALAAIQQVDRVVALKERHLETAREELGHLVQFLEDLRALGLAVGEEPSALSDELEGELRRGRLAALKQQMRAVRFDVGRSLSTSFPAYVTGLGQALLRHREDGRAPDGASEELVRLARAYVDGRTDEAVHRLRLLAETLPPGDRTAVPP